MALCAREAGGAVLALTVMKEERIAEGPVMFTPDEEFLRRVAERRKEIREKGEKTGEK